MTQHTWDAVIIGSGAAGLSAAQALGRSLRRTLVIDAGQPRNRFAAHMHNVLGHDGTPPLELIGKGKIEAESYGVQFRDGRVESVRDLGATLALALDDGSEIIARSVVLATGVSDDLPPIPGLAQHWGSSVLHCPYCHGWEVRNTRIAVVPTSPLGMHQALLLRQWTDQLTVFTDALGELDEAATQRLLARGIELVSEPISEVVNNEQSVTAIRTVNGRELPIDAIFTAATLRPHDEMLASLQLKRSESPFGSFIAVDPTGRTSHPRIWAVGNVVAPATAVPQAMAAGAMAGGGLNFVLVEEDFDLAQQAQRSQQTPTSGV
ncbi:NAD(P)/FAD-dependent oxidoreductase [Leucobacter sp. UT-8R-CII-1-4]|uniref:NAD(P)/FAD-dependent oxidoreductase n=1 Tax=Leucobacter sp. UT-8R-CII-1-4 TaxID=3040075 RepID=UPI0024A84B3C|nr:NAD(P)/FAD-dependent oxidoreductase [Leucobacter sp. UT-8R-CII-1-4]MDI6023701.1 NAD(P)/FAD-dependent oxidoreductase [Leucobacter sp. UT-8R-CII-1-4]